MSVLHPTIREQQAWECGDQPARLFEGPTSGDSPTLHNRIEAELLREARRILPTRRAWRWKVS